MVDGACMKSKPGSNRKKYTKDLLNQYFEFSNDMLCVADHTGYFKLLNPEWEKVLGYSNEELMEKPYISLVHPDDVESTVRAAKELAFQTKVYGFSNRYRCKDGSYRWLEWHSYPKDDLVFATVRDISEKKIIEEKLEHMHTLHSAILDNAGYSIITTDTAGIITLVNRAAEELLGYSAGELTGLNIGTAIHSREEMIRKAAILSEKLGRPVDPDFEVLIAEAQLGKPQEYEWTFIRKDGSHLPVLLKVTSLLDSSKAIIGYIGIASDLTEKKRDLEIFRLSEQRFTDIFNLSPNMIVITYQSNGQILSANPALTRISGYSREEYLNRSLMDLHA